MRRTMPTTTDSTSATRKTATSTSPTRCAGQAERIDMVLIRTYVSQLEHFRRLRSMVEFTARLERLGRLICFDHRGTGLSDRLRGSRLPTIEERSRRSASRSRCRRKRAARARRARRRWTARLHVRRGPSGADARRSCSATRDHGSPGPATTPGACVRPSSSESSQTSNEVGVRVRWPRPTPGERLRGDVVRGPGRVGPDAMRVSAGPGDAAAAVSHVLRVRRPPRARNDPCSRSRPQPRRGARCRRGALRAPDPGRAPRADARNGFLRRLRACGRVSRRDRPLRRRAS